MSFLMHPLVPDSTLYLLGEGVPKKLSNVVTYGYGQPILIEKITGPDKLQAPQFMRQIVYKWHTVLARS